MQGIYHYTLNIQNKYRNRPLKKQIYLQLLVFWILNPQSLSSDDLKTKIVEAIISKYQYHIIPWFMLSSQLIYLQNKP